jgi:hypothetical protein
LFFLVSALTVNAIVGEAPLANQSIARHVVMVIGSDNTFCSGVVIAQDLVLTAAQCIHPGANYSLVGFDRLVPKYVAKIFLHPEFDPASYLRRRMTADVALLKLIAPLPPAYAPVALTDSPVSAGSRVIVAGFGQANAGDNKSVAGVRAASLVVTGNPHVAAGRKQDHCPSNGGKRAVCGRDLLGQLETAKAYSQRREGLHLRRRTARQE